MKHSQSESYVEAVKMEATLTSPKADGGIWMGFKRVDSAESKAMLSALKCTVCTFLINER